MNDFVERLLEFINYCGFSQNEFELKCGVSHTNLREKKQGPTAMYLMKIVTAFPELNLNWLFRGEGEMLLSKVAGVSPKKEEIHTVNIGNWDALADKLKEIINNK